MAETFLFNIAEKLLGKLASLALDEISKAWNVYDDLKKLKDTLTTVQAVLLDAEDKQSNNKELTVWLSKLKDACYDAEDLLADFRCEVLQRQAVPKFRRIFSKSLNHLTFRSRVAKRIGRIRDRLDEIAAQKNKFHLSERLVDERVVHRRRETHSYVQASEVLGRDDDREKIIKMLFEEGEGDDGRLGVVPIVGIGGLGKTTLAKMVYNDSRVESHYALKVWVCVSDEFETDRLIKDIISAATGIQYGDVTIDQLQARLRQSLAGRRFLLVLDDVWNEDRVKWNQLKDLLLECDVGSSILVTTRSSKVGLIMGTVPSYDLPGLQHKDCLLLFLKSAFNTGQETLYPDLVEIANEIVRKCGGIPLAVRTLGCLLYASTEKREWLYIRDNEIWKLQQKEDDIMPVLKLSYDQMPSYLKQCFAYCALFPKDYVFHSFELIQFWMAHGLLESVAASQDLEDNGMRFMKELWSRSFFQEVDDHGFFYTFKMHDLVHDLALSVSARECLTLNFRSENVEEKARHLSFSGGDSKGQDVPVFLRKLEGVRTIMFPGRGTGISNKIFVDTCIARFKHLHLLNLSDSTFSELPDSIGGLSHLRYLDIYRNRNMRRLPDSICKLLKLETLKLEECEKLEEIPRDIKNLISLRFLELTTKLTSFPEGGIEALSSLRFLSLFECSNLESLFVDMHALGSLRTLIVSSCGNLASFPPAIKSLAALETLVIGDCLKLDLMEMAHDEDSKLRLSSLVLGELPLLGTLPPWLRGSASTLKYLYIDDCPNFTSFPEWTKELTALVKLEIQRCPRLLSLPDEVHCLPSLRELRIRFSPDLCERYEPGTGEDWHKIAHLPHVFLNGVKVKSADANS